MSNQPDYTLTCLRKDTQDRNNNLGAAWRQEDGSLRIKLNPGVALSYHPDLLIALFPKDKDYVPKRKPSKPSADTSNDDIPF